ncbi:YggS family pyridoxal phosphate-dependent enzyme [Haloferula rosea]|uniref:Pyridoxal phosphate homeostasis protein n=1 Tax=Haloferula rosea TaxID=490093 RepID=A0A934RBD1_9BACT|nr:YggS family pyridoxal phosphate-dependent enzyme [Haloferula rosea]MBK1828554.1 YggS family pyridoxal phosphate-dependent enzyme [Haloferula rosea]
MNTSADRLVGIQDRIRNACERAGRDASDVCLLAVSKRFPPAMIEPVVAAGQLDLGESRQQEAAEKVAVMSPDIRWHFIGKLQRNKARKVLEDFEVIHSVDSLKLAGHLNRIAGELGKRPKVYFEVNQAGEERKGGFPEEEFRRVFGELMALEHLEVLGLMTIPPQVDSAELVRPWFAKLRNLRDQLAAEHRCSLPGLSMGMSHDFEIAVEEGSTVVRVGSAIFGQRPSEV